ncbi:MAG TPA: ABC transporter permease [Gaiellaceae bacterium]
MEAQAAEPVPGLRTRPRRRALLAVIRRDFMVARSYRLAFAFDLVFTVLNLLVAYFVSRTFAGVTTASLDGAPSYFDFAAVGLTLSAVVAATSTGLAARVREEQLTGTLEALVAQPVTPSELAFGFAGFPISFATVRTAAYLLVAGTLLGLDVSRASWPGFVIILLLTATAFVGIGILAGALVLVVKRADALTGGILFAMSLISGAAFPVSVLPSWLEALSRISPMRPAFDGVRAALFGGDWHGDALFLAIFSVVGIPAAVFLFGRGLAYGRRAGSLGQY